MRRGWRPKHLKSGEDTIAGVVVGGILTSFNATVWTLAYRVFADKLTAKTPAPAADTSA